MPTRPVWAPGSYAIGTTIIHEAVYFTCIQAHTAVAGALGNEPNACPDYVWKQFWLPVSPMWADWLFTRMPQWMQALDTQYQNTFLQRFLSILGRCMDQTDDDSQRLALLKDIDQTPVAYLDDYASTLGILLPHAFDTVDPDAARRFLQNIVALYKRKGCLPSLEFIATAYLGITVSIVYESVPGHFYVMTYDDTAIPSGLKNLYLDELTAIATLYQPAGLVPVIIPASATADVGELGGGGGSTGVPYSPGKGDVGESSGAMVTLNVLYSPL